MTGDLEFQLRRLILVLLTFGLLSTLVDLFGLGHHEESWQIVPIVFLATALLVIVWHVIAGGPNSLLVFRMLMPLFLLVGLIGVVQHARGSMEFQLETNPALSGWPLIRKILNSKAPPVMAPGIMVQLGLLGIIYGYRHPGSTK
jgi:uncharacterized protein YneF (UPF0154 family)